MAIHFGYDAPLWQNIEVLGGIERPRHATVPIKGLPYQGNGKEDAHVILATEEVFSQESYRNAIHDEIRRLCDYSHASEWVGQSPFFHAMMGSFFAGNSDMPAWITIFPKRVTVKFRQEEGRVISQVAEKPVAKADGQSSARYQLQLGSIDIQCSGLNLAARPGISIRETKIVHQKIRRGLPYEPGTAPRFTLEVWCYRFTEGLDDAEAKAAKVPSMQNAGLFDEGSGILDTPHISLGKLLASKQHAEFFSFDLHPEGGSTLDFRSMVYELPYLLISNLNNHALLRSIVTPGHWSPF